MTEPLVACICLTRDRTEMTKRAIRSFQAQSYKNKFLTVFDSSARADLELVRVSSGNVWYVHFPSGADLSFGALRNEANAFGHAPDILMHFDSDDVSNSNRIAEQVAFLQESGADAVGYNEMLFWKEPRCADCGEFANTNCEDPPMGCRTSSVPLVPGEAWLYRNGNPAYFLDTSACYWRCTWERQPFPNMAAGADTHWVLTLLPQAKLKARGVSSVVHHEPCVPPRMIATIHSSNTCSRVDAGKREWRRAPAWDGYCRRTLAMEAEFVPVAGNPDERGNEI